MSEDYIAKKPLQRVVGDWPHHLLAWVGVSATYQVVEPPPQSVEADYVGGSMLPAETMPSEPPDASEYDIVERTVQIESLLSVDGVRYLFTSFVPNFMGFTAMGIILIVMIGVGVAERSGLIAALIRKLVAASSGSALTYIIVFLGVVSSIASAAGLGFARGAGTLRGKGEVIDAITKSWAGLAGLLLLFLLIAQFIAYFNYSNMPQVAAVKLGDLIDNLDIGVGWLLLVAIAITLVVGIVIPQAIAKWALLAPIFIPLFLRLGVEPEAVLAARYDRRSGIGTVIALMLPYFVVMTIAWTAFFLAWHLFGLPWGF